MPNFTGLKIRLSVVAIALTAWISSSSQAATFSRWTKGQLSNAELKTVVEAVRQKTGFNVTDSDFVLDEDRDLAFNHYRRYSQLVSGVRVKNAAIRIWSDKGLIQAEANVENPEAVANSRTPFSNLRPLSPAEANKIAQNIVVASEDASVVKVKAADFIDRGRLVREMTVTGKRGKHVITIDVQSKKVVSSKYEPFPTGDVTYLKAKVFPYYEEYNGNLLSRRDVTLKNLKSKIRRPEADPFSELRATNQFLYSKYDPQRAATPEGQAEGYWSDRIFSEKVAAAIEAVPVSKNSFANGLLLQGKYATVDINPDAHAKYPGIQFPLKFATQPYLEYKDVVTNGENDTAISPFATYYNKAFNSLSEIYEAPATHDPQHNPETYLNEGFDQIQVYYAIDKLFEVLHANGWTDPELSTRPFNAILYNPDISMRDNAYYTSDTINFTTYTLENKARDNTTIWHELGHGIMDRLMGEVLNLADTGGLSEGMADFVAALVLQGVAGDEDFAGRADQRIINKTGFFLTNEVHDDGEAYGGSMKDILDVALKTWGPVKGLRMMTDLTFETMRLTRDHPALTASDWFEHMIYADSLGRRGLRTPGQMKSAISDALQSRNFFANEADRGKLSLKFNGNEVIAGKPGSRGYGIKLKLAPSDTTDLSIALQVENGDQYQFQFPLKLRVFYRTGPLQGAVHWDGEEATFKDIIVTNPTDSIELPLKVSGTCDFVNREDGSCVDFVYVHILKDGEDTAIAKKRFYVQVFPTTVP